MNLSELRLNSDWIASSMASPADKSKLASKLREENIFLRDVCMRKHEQAAQLRDRKKELIELIRNGDADIKTKTLALARLKDHIEQAQHINVGSANLGLDDRRDKHDSAQHA